MKAVEPGLPGRRRAARRMCALEPTNIPANDCLPAARTGQPSARRPTPRAGPTGSPLQAVPTNFLRKAPFAIKIVRRTANISNRVGQIWETVRGQGTARPRDRLVPCSASVVHKGREQAACLGARAWSHRGPTNAGWAGMCTAAGHVAPVLQPRCVCELSFGRPSWPRCPVSEGDRARVAGAACVRASSGLTARWRGWC